MTTDELKTRDWLVNCAQLAVDRFLIDHATQMRGMSPAARAQVTMEATIGYLLGLGLIHAVPEDDAPLALPFTIPDHLRPRLDGR